MPCIVEFRLFCEIVIHLCNCFSHMKWGGTYAGSSYYLCREKFFGVCRFLASQRLAICRS